jgi:hypothetical protein
MFSEPGSTLLGWFNYLLFWFILLVGAGIFFTIIDTRAAKFVGKKVQNSVLYKIGDWYYSLSDLARKIIKVTLGTVYIVGAFIFFIYVQSI